MTLLCVFMGIKTDKSLMLDKFQSLFSTRKRLLGLLLTITIVSASVPILSKYEWSGFGEDSKGRVERTEETLKDGKFIVTKNIKHFESGKTLWDWLSLGGTIAIPVMIYVFQAGEQRRAEKRAKAEKEIADERAKAEKEIADERAKAEKEAAEKRADAEKKAAAERAKVEKEIADANLCEEALQAYIDRMAEILIDKNCRSELLPDKNNSNDTNIDNAVRDVARVRTTTILRRLESDRVRQGHVLDFLRDAGLLEFILSGANLSGAKLNKAFLRDANLSSVKLIGIDLTAAKLNRANLSDANLKNANLNEVDLSNADLSGANLIGTYLFGANIEGTNFTNVKNLTVEQVKVAKNWEKAKYNPEFYSLLGLPPEKP